MPDEQDEALRIARMFFFGDDERPLPKPTEEPYKYEYGLTRFRMEQEELGKR